jgi:hypothetical protein
MNTPMEDVIEAPQTDPMAAALAQLASSLLELNGAILRQVVGMCRQVGDDGADFDAVLKLQLAGTQPTVPPAVLAVSARALASHATLVHDAVRALVGTDGRPTDAMTLSSTAASLQSLCELAKRCGNRSLCAQTAYLASVAAGNLYLAHQAGESVRAMEATARHFARVHGDPPHSHAP